VTSYGYDLVLIVLKVAVLLVCAGEAGQFVYQAF
jgi:hypothetical protein